MTDVQPSLRSLFTPQETPSTPLETAASSPEKKPSFLRKLFPSRKRKNTASENSASSSPKKAKKKKLLLAFWIFLGIVGVILVGVGVYTFHIATTLKTQAQEAEVVAQQAYALFKTQNLAATQQELQTLQEKRQDLRTTYEKLSFYQYVPGLNLYYGDGLHAFNAAEHGLNAGQKALAELIPYADVLGFEGEGSFTGGTAEDRIQLLIETLEKVMPSFDAIATDLTEAKNELLAINPNRYPESVRGMPVREKLIEVQTLAENSIAGFLEFRPVLEQLPDIAGGKGERKKYLILFQNDNELRPTGGFLTAYAVIFVENGKVTPEKSDDIYELDKKFSKNIPIPTALGKYLTTERYWNLRDMNISPDFRISMDQFFTHYKTVRGEPTDIDGIISVDTHVLRDLLSVLGPVQIPGYGTFSSEPEARCDGCAQVVYALSEIITRPTPYLREDRKGILGPLMQSTLQKAYSAPKEKWPELFQTMWKNLEGKHIQMYFLDEEAQAAAEAVDGAGRLVAPDDGNDFLAIVNANLGGAKSNLFVNYDVKQEVFVPENGKLEKSVEITYRNNRKADNCNLEAGLLCLNGTLRDWTRLYLPLGTELVEAQGFTSTPSTYEEAGFTVIDGFFTLEPLGVAKLKLTYRIPYTDLKVYKTHIWKQGGIDPFETLFTVNGGEEKVLINKDSLIEIPF